MSDRGAQGSGAGTVVITGSTRGIGYGLAEAFLSRGASVVITGRTAEGVDAAVTRLSSGRAERVVGVVCDVSRADDLEALWAAASGRFGTVDVWINNAGTCNAALPFVELPPSEVLSVVDTNVRGTMLASQIALRGMRLQGHGQLFNMEGWGSRGEWSPGLTAYGATKRATRYFTDAIAKESRKEPIRIGTLSPGMVATDLLVSSWQRGTPENWLRMKWLFHFVIDPPEPVCDYLARKVLHNRRTGVHFTWMTPWRLLVRFFQPYYWRRQPVAGTALERLGE